MKKKSNLYYAKLVREVCFVPEKITKDLFSLRKEAISYMDEQYGNNFKEPDDVVIANITSVTQLIS